MSKMMFLLLAALPPATTWAQIATQAGQEAQKGRSFCGHVMDAVTFVDARAKNASGDEALVIRWFDLKSNAIHSALVMGRCVAKDGDTIDGKVIVRVLPSLAVSNQHGRVGWEAEYRYMYGPLGGGPSRRGLFDQDRFVTELDANKASEPGSASGAEPDFWWNEEQETLIPRPGVLPPSPYTYATAPPKSAQPSSAQPAPTQAPASAAKPCTPQSQQGPKVTVKTPPKASAWVCKTIGMCPENKPVVLNPDNGCPAAPAPGQPAK